MSIVSTSTTIPTLRINQFSTLEDYQLAYASGYITENELSFIDENLNPDWNQTDSTKPDYIKNKPIPTPTVADAGKVLVVGSTGAYELVPISSLIQ